MPFISVRDIKIYYEVHGTGSRVLFINGTGGDLRRRPGIFDSPLVEYFEILAYDQRGLGRTDRPDMPYTMADYAMDADALLDAVGWDNCSVLGISFGGMVAQVFALRCPHRIQRLVLACTSSGGAGGESYPLHELGGLPPREWAQRFIPISDKRCDEAWQAAHPGEFQETVDQIVADLAIGADEPGRRIGARRQLEARLGHDTYDRLPGIKMPVYICGGRYDAIAPAANLEAIRKQIPHARLELFEGGHLFFLQDAAAFKRIAAFLRGELDDAE